MRAVGDRGKTDGVREVKGGEKRRLLPECGGMELNGKYFRPENRNKNYVAESRKWGRDF